MPLTEYERRLTRNALLPTDRELARRERESELAARTERYRVENAERLAKESLRRIDPRR